MRAINITTVSCLLFLSLNAILRPLCCVADLNSVGDKDGALRYWKPYLDADVFYEADCTKYEDFMRRFVLLRNSEMIYRILEHGVRSIRMLNSDSGETTLLPVSVECLADSVQLVKGVMNGELWAIKSK